MNGYAHPGYALSLAEFGRPRSLPASGGWVLERPLPGGQGQDAMGPYPLFCCPDWSGLGADLQALEGRLVSLALVADPFGDYSLGLLKEQFLGGVRPYKPHFVADLSLAPRQFVAPRHRQYARAALKQVQVRPWPQPGEFLETGNELYAHLVARHRLRGLHVFSRRAFAGLLAVPGVVVLAAEARGQVVGAHIWMVQGEVAYSHLIALSPQGYALRAAYALHGFALEYFAGQARWLDFGGSAGAGGPGETGGLNQFKRGWASGMRTAYLCTRILDPEAYARLAPGAPPTGYFPAYRAGELTQAEPDL